MGTVLGATSPTEAYAYTVVADHKVWQRRRYPTAIAAETNCDNDDNKGFRRLERYTGSCRDEVAKAKPKTTRWGCFPTPQKPRQDTAAARTRCMATPLTTPVVNTVAAGGGPVAMTTPLVNSVSGGSGTMRFVLPSKYKSIKDVPPPTDSSVRIVQLPAKEVAALPFSGSCSGPSDALAKYEELLKLIKAQGLKPVGPWELHRFNPPYTLGPLRKNEVVVPVGADRPCSSCLPCL